MENAVGAAELVPPRRACFHTELRHGHVRSMWIIYSLEKEVTPAERRCCDDPFC